MRSSGLELFSHLLVGEVFYSPHLFHPPTHELSEKKSTPRVSKYHVQMAWNLKKKTTPLKQAVQLIYYKNDYYCSFPFIIYSRNMHLDQHIGLMYGVFTYMLHRNQPFM